MSRRLLALGVLICFVATGCATTAPGGSGQQALLCGKYGALAGGVAGAGIGAVSQRGGGAGQMLLGALVGGVIGAVTGGVVAGTVCFGIAEYKSQQVKDYRQTSEAVGYTPTQGDVLRITKYSIEPAAAAPGNVVTFQATYYVMTPTPDADVSVTETRIVKVRDVKTGAFNELGRVPHMPVIKPGTRQADGKFEIPRTAAEGQYLMIFEVSKNGRSEAKELALQITNDASILAANPNRRAEVSDEPAVPPAAAPAPQRSASGSPPDASGVGALGLQPNRPGAGSGGTAAERGSSPPLSSLGEDPEKQPPPKSQAVVARAEPSTPTPKTVPKPDKVLVFVAAKAANLRAGPGPNHAIVGTLAAGNRYPIVGRTSDRGGWYKIRLDDGREVWVGKTLGSEVEE